MHRIPYFFRKIHTKEIDRKVIVKKIVDDRRNECCLFCVRIRAIAADASVNRKYPVPLSCVFTRNDERGPAAALPGLSNVREHVALFLPF